MRGTMVQETSESKTDAVIRLMKSGGHLLVAGGGVKNLPDKIRCHPQIILWDDNEQGLEHKQVPSNTRAILYNRWLSHALAGRLRYAAGQLKIPVFPMLKTAEIKNLLAEFVQDDPAPAGESEMIDIPDTTVEEVKPFLMEEDVVQKPKQGQLKEFVAKHVKGDLTVRGTIRAEAVRLFPLLKEAGIKSTLDSVAQAIKKHKDGLKDIPKGRSVTTTAAVVPMTDDFAEAEKLLKDARAAIDLFLDFVPKLRREVMSLRKMQAKMKDLLGD